MMLVTRSGTCCAARCAHNAMGPARCELLPMSLKRLVSRQLVRYFVGLHEVALGTFSDT